MFCSVVFLNAHNFVIHAIATFMNWAPQKVNTATIRTLTHQMLTEVVCASLKVLRPNNVFIHAIRAYSFVTAGLLLVWICIYFVKKSK